MMCYMFDPDFDSLQKLAKRFIEILMQQETKVKIRPHGKPPHHSPEKKTRLKTHQKILKYPCKK